MWGRKAVERFIVPSVSFEEAKLWLQDQGFQLVTSNPDHAVFKSQGTENPWTTLAPDGRNVPIELALAKGHDGLYLHLRYATFCLFDTGDLSDFADEIASCLRPANSII